MSATDAGNASGASQNGLEALPIADVLGDLRIPALSDGSTARGVLALVKAEEPDGTLAWAVRVTADLDDEVLVVRL